ncbi:hypothetical protein STEG23_014390 [Scotinomys teguina]
MGLVSLGQAGIATHYTGLYVKPWFVGQLSLGMQKRAVDPDVALGSSPDPDITMVPGDSTGHSDQHDPCSGMALGHQHDQRDDNYLQRFYKYSLQVNRVRFIPDTAALHLQNQLHPCILLASQLFFTIHISTLKDTPPP